MARQDGGTGIGVALVVVQAGHWAFGRITDWVVRRRIRLVALMGRAAVLDRGSVHVYPPRQTASVTTWLPDRDEKPLSLMARAYGAAGPVCAAAVWVVVLLCGCATVPNSIPPEQAQSITKVGVVSLIGDEFGVMEYGLSVFQNKSARQSVAPWGLDAAVEEALKGLGAMASYPVVSLATARGDLLALTHVNSEGARKLRLPKRTTILRGLRDAYGVDALLVVSCGAAQHMPLANGNRLVVCRGTGVTREVALLGLGGNRNVLHSTVAVDVYSTTSSELLARSEAFRWVHVDDPVLAQCRSGAGAVGVAGLEPTVTNLVVATVCDALLRLRLIRLGEPTDAGYPATCGVRTPGLLDGVRPGMGMREVFDTIGQPTGAEYYGPKGVLVGLYMMSQDQVRLDALYRGAGRVTFCGAGPSGVEFRVCEIMANPKETGVVNLPVGLRASMGRMLYGWWGLLERT